MGGDDWERGGCSREGGGVIGREGWRKESKREGDEKGEGWRKGR